MNHFSNQSKSLLQNLTNIVALSTPVNVVVTPAQHLRGEVTLPGDKSITHRALMIGAISEGTTEVEGFSSAADPMSTLNCIRALGVETRKSGELLSIIGKGLGRLSRSQQALDAGNSGTTIRLLAGILAAQKFESTITGDESLRQRPMGRIIAPLTQMGARIESTLVQTPPLKIYAVDRLKAMEYTLPVPSAQVKSAIIFAGLHAEGVTRVIETIPTRDHTERMLDLNVKKIDGGTIIQVDGRKKLEARRFTIPGDISAATYFVIGACLVPDSELLINNVGLNPTRTAILDILKKMGAKIEINELKSDELEPRGNLLVRSSRLTNVSIPTELIPSLIDELPVLAVAGAMAKGKFDLRGALELRVKESDRIRSLCENLKRLGVSVDAFEDGFAFEGENRFIPSTPLESYGDHRVAMAMGVAGLVSEQPVEILDAECVDISFPKFWNKLKSLTL